MRPVTVTVPIHVAEDIDGYWIEAECGVCTYGDGTVEKIDYGVDPEADDVMEGRLVELATRIAIERAKA